MDWINIFTTAAVLLICIFSLLALALRTYQTGNVGIVGMVASMGFLTACYSIFLYNAFYGLSNAPYRYFLRFANGSVALSICIFSISNYRLTSNLATQKPEQLNEP